MPATIVRRLYKRIYQRVRKISPDMALSVQHPGQIVPDLEAITTVGLTDELTAWLKSADHLFYTWHWSVPPLGLPLGLFRVGC